MKIFFSKSFKLVLVLLMSLSTLITNANNLLSFSHQFTRKENHLEQTANTLLPDRDIREFVTAISVVHHYYIQQIKNDTLFDNAISGMVGNLDPHSAYLDANGLKNLNATIAGKFVGIGVELMLKDNLLQVISPLEESPAAKANLKSGDLIVKINGVMVGNLSLDQAVSRIRGKKGTKVMLTIVRTGRKQPFDVSVTRDEIKFASVKNKLLENNYGYIRISIFQGSVEKQLRHAIKKLQNEANNQLAGLILDLRDNPGGLLDVSAKVADDFLDSTKLNKYNGVIVATHGRVKGTNISIKATPGDLLRGVPLVVLINHGSASASEIVAGALQDYKRAIIIGTRSFGKGSVQTILPVGNDSAIKLTTALYYTPAGKVIQAHGIIPDVMVPPTLSVNNIDQPQFFIGEADIERHLLGQASQQATSQERQRRNKLLKSQMQLAKKDYLLYQALVLLQGLKSYRH